MSIIEEALRRLQEGTAEREGSAKPSTDMPAVQAPPREEPAPPETGAHSWPTTAAPAIPPAPAPAPQALLSVAAVVLVLGAILGSVGVVWLVRQAPGRVSAPAQPATPALPTATSDAAPAPRPAARPSPAPKRSTGPTLSGVVVGEGERFAVIDGQVCKEGDQVGDATLIEITDASALLRRQDGTDVTLQLPR